MPTTVPFGLPFENLGEEPTRTLNGGSDGLSAILAQETNDALVGLTSDIGGLDTRLAALETAVSNSRWRLIARATGVSGADFTIAVPAGYERLRLHISGELSAADLVDLRLNGNTGNVHRWGGIGFDGLDSFDIALGAHQVSVNHIRLAEWSSVESNMIIVDIAPADGTTNPAVMCRSTRISDTADTNKTFLTWGKLQSDVVVSSLLVFTAGAATFASTTRYWLEGFLS